MAIGDAAQREVGVAAADGVDDADAERRQLERLARANRADAMIAVGHRYGLRVQQASSALRQFRERQPALVHAVGTRRSSAVR